jgi:hypothetical protein
VNGAPLITCPIPGCGAAWQAPQRKPVPANLARQLDIEPQTLSDIQLSQLASRLEDKIRRHMVKHPPTQWLPELTRLAQRITALEAEKLRLQAEVDTATALLVRTQQAIAQADEPHWSTEESR